MVKVDMVKEAMMLDLRLPVGLFFLLIGAVLTVDGLLHPITTPGVNLVLNRDWGICLLLFGALMTFFGVRAQRHSGD
jgi:hypothetical protein